MTQFSSRHPIYFSIIAVFLAVAALKLVEAGLTLVKLPLPAIRLMVEAVFCAYVFWLITRLGWWREAGFKRLDSWRRLWVLAPYLLLPAAVLATNPFKPANLGAVVWAVAFTLMVGFAEEGLLRGVVLRALLPGGLARAVLLSSLMFGIGHLVNIWQGFNPGVILVQIVYSILLGIGFAGARLYSGSIWPVLVVHTLVDFTSVAASGFVVALPKSVTLAGVIAPIAITGLYALYGWWLLRRAQISPVAESLPGNGPDHPAA